MNTTKGGQQCPKNGAHLLDLIFLDGMLEVGNLALSVLFNVAIGAEAPAFEEG